MTYLFPEIEETDETAILYALHIGLGLTSRFLVLCGYLLGARVKQAIESVKVEHPYRST